MKVIEKISEKTLKNIAEPSISARLVLDNRVLYSEDLTAASYSSNGYVADDFETLSTSTATYFRNTTGIAVVPGEKYIFSFWAKNVSATAMSYSVYDVTHALDIIANTNYFADINSSTYSKISVEFTAPAGCLSVYAYPAKAGAPATHSIKLTKLQLRLSSSSNVYVKTTDTAVIP